MPLPYSFDRRVVFRTPLLPLSEPGQDISPQNLLQNDHFLEALYLASSVLYEECIKWKNGTLTAKKDVDRLMRSVHKYYLRMSSRCTPFGLFSGCAVTRFNPASTTIRLDNTKRRRHTRLDMQYLCALARHLSTKPLLRSRLLYFPNNSLYRIGKELRYVEYAHTDEARSYQISSVVTNDYLESIRLLAEEGVTIRQLTDFLSKDDIPAPQSNEYIEKLIASQLLVSELEPCITGKEFMAQIITILQRIASEDAPAILSVLHTLTRVQHLLDRLDNDHTGGIHYYRSIMQQLDGLGVAYNESRLFQTDSVLGAGEEGGLSTGIQTRITEALSALDRLTPTKGSQALRSFAIRYSQRYGDKEMPLSEVLDTETGIGYLEGSGGGVCPLVGDLQISTATPEQQLGWGKVEMLLHDRLEAAKASGTDIRLTDDDLRQLSPSLKDTDLPASLPVMFRCFDNDSIYLELAGGSSAVNLLGRFAHADPAIHELADDIARAEQQQDPDVIYAEITHLPESRTGNILLHPAFRTYEIPYLARASVEKQFQLDLHDIYISVNNGKVVLRSHRLGKTIIPRLSTAHNYGLSTLPVYRLLCDLQTQGKKASLTFSWGSLRFQHCHLPRVSYRNTILSLASWNFSTRDIETWKNKDGDELLSLVSVFRTKWNLPAQVLLSEGDNELPLDLCDSKMVQLLQDCVKNKETFLLKEFIRPEGLIRDDQGRTYTGQFIAILHRNGSSYAPSLPARPAAVSRTAPAEQREFTLGSEWLYFKLYCGVRSADRILTEAVAPMTEELQQFGLIDKWFFIRYNDPEFHLRVRFHLRDTRHIGDVILIIHSYLHPFEKDGYIWRLQTETYTRELERYGRLATSLAESLFHSDSEACLRMLVSTPEQERATMRWMWALLAIDNLLDCFDIADKDKLRLLQQLRDAFASEFRLDKPLKTQLNDKYRVYRTEIGTLMQAGEPLTDQWHPLVSILAERSAAMQPIAARINALLSEGRLEVTLTSLLGSYIHMMVNRIVTSDSRLHELVIYDFLCRTYVTRSYIE
ncbi:MAG: lantibiotic dehydratase, partial [Bacteroidetes bacterium]|nr:lantibiotic dehydratase [Bacteroidota bacterium]